MIEETDEDIYLDADGQPAGNGDGDVDIAEGDACWLQDLKNEAVTEEGELFYEDEDGDDAYGFGLLDFLQAEDDEDAFLKLEIEQRIKAKLGKRSYIDDSSIVVETVTVSREHIEITAVFQRVDEDTQYTLNLEVDDDGVEVEIEYD